MGNEIDGVNTISLTEGGAAATPTAGKVSIYSVDGDLRVKDDQGAETVLGSGGGGGGSSPTSDDKDLVANNTSGDEDLATSSTITNTPVGYVAVFVNGWKYSVGNGVKTKACYFSGDSGSTARAFGAIVAGDELYWNGVIVGTQLISTDTIDLDYSA